MKPGPLLMLFAAGHTVWGSVAYRDALREIGRAGYVDSVGDGLFNREHSHDARAAAFWFVSIGPLLGLCGYLTGAASRAGDERALQVSAGAVTAMAAAGAVAMPRSGFPGGVAAGLWMLRRSLRS
jgi:hypothetical protein